MTKYRALGDTGAYDTPIDALQASGDEWRQDGDEFILTRNGGEETFPLEDLLEDGDLIILKKYEVNLEGTIYFSQAHEVWAEDAYDAHDQAMDNLRDTGVKEQDLGDWDAGDLSSSAYCKGGEASITHD